MAVRHFDVKMTSRRRYANDGAVTPMKKVDGTFVGAFCGAVAGLTLGGIPHYASIEFFALTTVLEGGLTGLLIGGAAIGATMWKYVNKGD